VPHHADAGLAAPASFATVSATFKSAHPFPTLYLHDLQTDESMENLLLLAQAQVSKPMLIGIGIAALVILFLAFKVTKFVIKMVLLLAAFAALAAAAWYYFGAR
jgi:hypothetical protein